MANIKRKIRNHIQSTLTDLGFYVNPAWIPHIKDELREHDCYIWETSEEQVLEAYKAVRDILE